MSGNEAVAVGAMAAGCDFFAGYPITPSSEIMEEMAGRLPRTGGKFLQMEDEIGAMAAVIGAALTGARAMTATSGPGFSLKQENIGFAAMAEVPCVVVDVMRGGPSTGLPTHTSQADVMQAAWGTHGDHPVLALCPSNPRETFDLTVDAFNLAERFRTPVMLMLDEIVGHGSERTEIPTLGPEDLVQRKRPSVPPDQYLAYEHTADGIPPMADYGSGYRFHVTGLSHDETGFPTNEHDEIEKLHRRLLWKVDRVVDELYRWEELGDPDGDVVFVAYGSTARSTRRAMKLLAEQGIRSRLIRPIVLWPFCGPALKKAAEKARMFVVVEMNAGQMALEVERAVCGRAPVARIGKLNGEIISPREIVEKLAEIRKNV